MNIAYVCADTGIPFLGGKGASVHLREMARALQTRGHVVTVACATLGSGNAAPPDLDVIVLDADPSRQTGRLGTAFRAWKIDAVLERYSLESGSARAASSELGIPLVLEVNAPIVLEAARYRGLADVVGALARERDVFAAADAAAVVSRALEEYVSDRAPALRVRRVPNGVDVSAFAGARKRVISLPEKAVAIGFVGSMKPWHGVADLIHAFRDVAMVRPEAHLVLAGAGPEEEDTRSLVRALELGERVVFLGALPHGSIPSLLAALDIGVAPYRSGPGFYFSSLKVLEYMAAGLPTVYPQIGDLPETIEDAGLSYRPDDVNGMAAAMLHLVEDAELRRRLGAEARSRVGAFTWDAVASQIEALIDTIDVRQHQEVKR